jgi:hypothetical protein
MVKNAQKKCFFGHFVIETVNMELYSIIGDLFSGDKKTMSVKIVSENTATENLNPTLARIAEIIGGIVTLITIVISAIILAEGVYGWATGGSIFYSTLEPSFKFILGFILLTLVSDKATKLPF